MSDWTPLSFGSGQVLSANQMNNLQGNVEAVRNQHKGPLAPDNPVAGTMWLADSVDPWIWRMYDGTSWLRFAEIDTNDSEMRLSNPIVSRVDSGFANFLAIANVQSEYLAGGRIHVRRSRGTKSSPLSVISGDMIGDYIFSAYNGTNFVPSAIIRAQTGEDWSSTNNGSTLKFFTTDVGTNQNGLRGIIRPNGQLEWYTNFNIRCDTEHSGERGGLVNIETNKDDVALTSSLIFRRSRGNTSSRSAINSGDALGNTIYAGQNESAAGGGFINVTNLSVFATQNFQNSACGVRQVYTQTLSGAIAASVIYVTEDDGGTIYGAPTGGSKGYGTINAEAVYDDGALLTCYPLEYARTGDIEIDKWDRLVPEKRPIRKHRVEIDEDGREREVEELEKRPTPPHRRAREFKARADMLLDPEQYANFWQTNGHLPAFPHVNSWQALSLGDISQRMWETVETQAVHIAKLTARINSLEAGGSAVIRGSQ